MATQIQRSQRGFTLVEIMVVVVILAIITSIAVNSFSGSTRDSQRARAMASLGALNDAAARYYQTAFTYTGATLAGLTASDTLSFPSEYVFALDVADDGQSYTVTATPTTTQVGDGAIMMNSTGQRCFYPGNDAPDFTTCAKPF
ncbi:MAG: type IV pilin protein [Pseudomonadota bacterium]